ncbi:MAG: hypothetical protein ACI81T_004503, partial [Bacteroidia bacterium]
MIVRSANFKSLGQELGNHLNKKADFLLEHSSSLLAFKIECGLTLRVNRVYTFTKRIYTVKIG